MSSGQDPKPRAGQGWAVGSGRRGLPFSRLHLRLDAKNKWKKTKQNPSPVIQTELMLAGQVDLD